jgi:acetylornithine deacetylase/succinyl-diaminopimelate desuccinylase-like protein
MEKADEAVTLLSDVIKIDSTNPPGNEEAVAQFVQDFLKREGLNSEIFLSAPGRGNIMATIEGKRRGRPIILLSHSDVVPAKEEEWDVPPFSGIVKGGFIYGRGAIDMKSQLAVMLLAFVALKREGVTPENDIVFLATADEEVGGTMGAEYMFEKVKGLADAQFVLSEGGCLIEEDGFVHAQVSVAEKKICQFMIRAAGTGGHASMPHNDNANDKVVRAANRIISYDIPFRPTKIVTKYLDGLLKGKRVGGIVYETLSKALRSTSFRKFIKNHPVYNALLRNTVTLTMLKGGEKVNVIPTESAVQFDSRILPNEDHETFLRRIQRVAGIDVEVVSTAKGDSLPSSFNTPYFSAISKVVKRIKGDVPVLPFVTTGATDLRYFRRLGIPAYGFFPMTLSKDELFRMHGVNERISVENVAESLEATLGIVRALAAIRDANPR